jgi:hypothetical protein
MALDQKRICTFKAGKDPKYVSYQILEEETCVRYLARGAEEGREKMQKHGCWECRNISS